MEIFCWNLNSKFTHGIINMPNQFFLYTKRNSKTIFGSNFFFVTVLSLQRGTKGSSQNA